MGLKSLIGQLNTHWAGDNFVAGSGVLPYWRMAHRSALVSRLPVGLVLLLIIRLTVFTATSALQFECGNATDDQQWYTPQSFRNWHVTVAVNSGPPSVSHLSGMLNVVNMQRKQEIRPWEPSVARSMMGQFE